VLAIRRTDRWSRVATYRAGNLAPREAQLEVFLLVLAAIFPIVNPPGSALVFLSMTERAPAATRRFLARRVALNSFFVMSGSLLVGTFVLSIYGISIPILRVAGGIIVAASGWKLLNEGNRKNADDAQDVASTDYHSMAFFPLTLPITTGPGTIAVMIGLGFGRTKYVSLMQEVRYVAMVLLATVATALAIYFCFAYADRVQRILGRAGTDIAVRLSAFILFCIGVQILWTGLSELIAELPMTTKS
jgi:multiple antibiotic resistance protein